MHIRTPLSAVLVAAIGMATIGHWKDGTMDHEWLFWDNQDFMAQIGLGGK